MKSIQAFAITVAFSMPLAAYAADPATMKPGDMNQSGSDHGGMGGMGMDSGNSGTMGTGNMQGAGNMPGMATGMSQGVIRKVDKSGRKITIKHGPLLNLDMPAMTMVFKVTDPVMMDQVKAGEKVNFIAERVKGALTITRVEAAR
jgi:Cu/Ag efflux protein CusF